MLRGSALLEAAQGWIADKEAQWVNSAVTSEVDLAPHDRDPRSISWILDGVAFVGQIVIWEDGKSELDLADVATGEVRSNHEQIDSQGELSSTLCIICDWVIRKGSE
jgi:hypothetical protein